MGGGAFVKMNCHLSEVVFIKKEARLKRASEKKRAAKKRTS